MTGYTNKRAGFTLIELMVVMALIALLTAMVMLVAPNVMDKDRARDAAVQLQGALQNARLRAMRDGLPRGVRLIVDPTSSAGSTSPFIYVTSSAYQYIEVPPVYVPNPYAPGPNPTTGNAPFVQISYSLAGGAITNRICTINQLTTDQLTQISYAVNNATAAFPATLILPTLGGFWATIVQNSFSQTSASSCTIVLAVYPDSSLGAETSWTTYQFGIYNAPRPLLGEPTMQMPVNTCVDLSTGVSSPAFSGIVGINDYDVLFNSSGQLMTPTGVGQVFLWVRDPTKGIPMPPPQLAQNPDKNGGAFCSMSPSAPTLGSFTPSQYSTLSWPTATTTGSPYNIALNQGGEQLLVTIKTSSGGTGVSPIFWGNPPYFYALSAANSP